MQKGGGEGVQIACKNVYLINGRPLRPIFHRVLPLFYLVIKPNTNEMYMCNTNDSTYILYGFLINIRNICFMIMQMLFKNLMFSFVKRIF